MALFSWLYFLFYQSHSKQPPFVVRTHSLLVAAANLLGQLAKQTWGRALILEHRATAREPERKHTPGCGVIAIYRCLSPKPTDRLTDCRSELDWRLMEPREAIREEVNINGAQELVRSASINLSPRAR